MARQEAVNRQKTVQEQNRTEGDDNAANDETIEDSPQKPKGNKRGSPMKTSPSKKANAAGDDSQAPMAGVPGMGVV